MSRDHPTYPNPTIQEAVCEIHFRLPGDGAWDAKLTGEFYRHVEADFPQMEPASTVGIQLEIGPEGMVPRVLPPVPRMQFRHRERNLLVQLSPYILTVNVLPRYPGWDATLTDILGAWQRGREAIAPAYVSRVGLRYINRIERTKPDEPPGEWIAPSKYVAQYSLASLPGFLSRLEARPSESDRLIVTLGEVTPGSPTAGRPIIFDIDCILQKDLPAGDDDALREAIGLLHDRAWDVFSSSLTTRLRQRLEGKL